MKAIADNLQRLSQYIPDFPQIEEFDTNPQMVLEEGKEELTEDIHAGLLKRNC
ncbi:MAG TPA: hypothetical protein VE130_11400 [Nitrososphaeraceae archaeon]|nr:hypothetical protein [Nitrososphaeraceae archaeon]